MHVALYLSFILATTPAAIANIPKNGVVLAANSLEDLMKEANPGSAYQLCNTQSRSARYFSNECTRLIESLRKKMSVMMLESDLQMQAEKLGKVPLPRVSLSRIAMLAKINLLATQAEETIKAAQSSSRNSDSKEDLPDILPAVKKVQQSYQAYLKLSPPYAKK